MKASYESIKPWLFVVLTGFTFLDGVARLKDPATAVFAPLSAFMASVWALVAWGEFKLLYLREEKASIQKRLDEKKHEKKGPLS